MIFRFQYYLFYFDFIIFLGSIATAQTAKDNGDIYIAKEETFLNDTSLGNKMQTDFAFLTKPNINLSFTTSTPQNSNLINFDELIATCNSSFYIPMQYYTSFNATAELPELLDKTGMCFIRCVFEKSGIIENWKLNGEKIRAYIWPAMGDTIEVCQEEGAKEQNACVRAYSIAKCLTLRSLVDARNKPV